MIVVSFFFIVDVVGYVFRLSKLLLVSFGGGVRVFGKFKFFVFRFNKEFFFRIIGNLGVGINNKR